MKKSFYSIFFILIIGAIGFFGFIKAQAVIQQNPSDVPVKVIDITKTEEKQLFNQYCKDFKLKSAAPETAQSECFNLIQKTIGTTGADTHSYGEVGKVNDAYYCCFLPHDAVFKTPLGTISPTAQTAEDRLKASQIAYKCGVGGAYDYKGGTGGKIDVASKNIKEGINLSWPKSPIRTSLLEEKDGSPSITIPQLIRYIYEWLISLGGFAAFIALVIAGVQYLTSAGNPGKMAEAISRIRSAGIGLILLLSSVLILNTINPRLINLGIDPGKLQNAPAPIFKEKDGSTRSFECGTPCQAVWFCSEPNFLGSCEKVNVGPGKTVTGELKDTKEIKSVKFLPETPLTGDCSVTMYQLPLIRPVTEEKPPLPPITAPANNIGSEQNGFQMKSYEVSDASGASDVEFNF